MIMAERIGENVKITKSYTTIALQWKLPSVSSILQQAAAC
jgi:hypothetical protein